jgi:hypothetical protein
MELGDQKDEKLSPGISWFILKGKGKGLFLFATIF